LEEKMVQHN